jgi:4-hydroxy-3-methylbut-2-en-1-yl diphosphate reductase
MEVLLAQPRGFCAGVVRAIQIVERALEVHGAPVYVFHEIVHNGHVVQQLRDRGAIFVDAIDAIPRGALTVFSAHGVALSVVEQSRQRGLRVIDATCPLVAKVHVQAQRYARMGHELIVVGHPDHDEVQGTAGSVTSVVHVVATVADVESLQIPSGTRVAYVTQTTLSVDDTRDVIAALQARFPHIDGPETDDICYATQNRQTAVRQLVPEVDLVLVVGARNSSNSNRLREVAELLGVRAYLIEDADAISPSWLAGVSRVGLTAGASTPDFLLKGVRERLVVLGAQTVRQMPGVHEVVSFRLPPSLEPAAARAKTTAQGFKAST